MKIKKNTLVGKGLEVVDVKAGDVLNADFAGGDYTNSYSDKDERESC
jgi:hypothetical protein